MARRVLLLAVLATALPSADLPRARAQAPYDGTHFANAAARTSAGPLTTVPFFARRIWTTLFHRSGAAPFVAYDPAALAHNPSVTWIGHATMLVRMDGATFLTDPNFADRASPLSFAGPKRHQPPGIPLDALPPVDFAVLSHDHYDHTNVESIRALARRGTRFVVPLGLGPLVREAGGEAVELDWWQSTSVAGVEVHCVPAQHFSGRSLTDGSERLWAGWVIVGPTRRYYHAGDTGYFAGFAEIGRRLGPIDLAAVPIGAYEPREMMRFVHVNPEEAARAAADVRARRTVGMHWGTFDLADEPLDEPPGRFVAGARAVGFQDGDAFTLAVGQTVPW